MIPAPVRETRLGNAFFEALGRSAHIETNREILDRIERISDLLHEVRGRESGRFEIVVPWCDIKSAFTLSGHYIYLPRRFHDRCRCDEQIAFAIAHEMAHHDLGHIVHGFDRPVLALLGAMVRHRFRHYEKESEADEYALALCERAGFDRDRCLSLFDTMRHYLLYLGHGALALGTNATLEEEVDGRDDWRTRLRQWDERRKMGYPSIWNRKERLRALPRPAPLTDSGAAVPPPYGIVFQ